MKFFLLLGVLTLAAGQTTEKPYPHFKESELNERFQHYRIPDACSLEMKSCVKGIHDLSKQCYAMRKAENGDEMEECRNENADLRDAEKSWQLASLAWHKAMDECLMEAASASGDRSHGTDGFRNNRRNMTEERRFRTKCNGASNYIRSDFDNSNECYGNFFRYKKACEACFSLANTGCQPYVQLLAGGVVAKQKYFSCMSKSQEPIDDTKKSWWNRTKTLSECMKVEEVTAKFKMLVCLEETEEE